MAGSTINSTIAVGVTLGSANYPSPLTITSAGGIVPPGSGSNALIATIDAGYVLNAGQISGGTGNPGSSGGIGIDQYNGGPGGIGVTLAAGRLTNTGAIGGGTGGPGIKFAGGFTGGGSGGGGGEGVELSGGSLINSGAIVGGSGGFGAIGFAPGRDGTSGAGIHITGGALTNNGSITGGAGASYAYNQAGADGADVAGGVLVNNGNVSGGAGGAGVLSHTGHLFFAVPGGGGGIGVRVDVGSLSNHGTITGGAGGGGVAAGSPIPPGHGGAGGAGVLVGTGSFANYGTIQGGTGGPGVYGGPGYDAAPGPGGIGVVFGGAGGTLIDAGFIGGGFGSGVRSTAVNFSGAASRLILLPGASFNGAVEASPSVSNVMELARGNGSGSIGGVGDSIVGFGTILFDSDAFWQIEVDRAGLLRNQTIELMSFAQTGSSFTGTGLVLNSVSGSDTIDVQGSISASDFGVTSDGGNIFVEIAPPCFVAGTRITAGRGDIAVEDLRIGDSVKLVQEAAWAPVVWIGQRTVRCVQHPRPRQVWPVRVAAGAFGRGLPLRDLWLSPDHAVFAAGVLVPVKFLINGTSIAQVPMDTVSYYHVELSRHSVLLADGLPTESYLDTGDRANFANGGASVTLFADFATRMWEAAGCAPLVVAGLELNAVRERVNAIAAISGPTGGETAIAA